MTDSLTKTFDTSAKIFTVIVPEGNGYSNPRTMSRITDHFQEQGLNAEFICDDKGLPSQDEHGAYTLVTKDEKAEMRAPAILSRNYGLMPIRN